MCATASTNPDQQRSTLREGEVLSCDKEWRVSPDVPGEYVNASFRLRDLLSGAGVAEPEA